MDYKKDCGFFPSSSSQCFLNRVFHIIYYDIIKYDDYSHFIVLSSHNICILYSMDIAKISMRLENALNRRNKLSAGMERIE